MQYRTMGKLGIKTSAFGLGCMRFNGVDIPGIFSVWNNVSLYDTDPKWDWGLRQIKEKARRGQVRHLRRLRGRLPPAPEHHRKPAAGLEGTERLRAAQSVNHYVYEKSASSQRRGAL